MNKSFLLLVVFYGVMSSNTFCQTNKNTTTLTDALSLKLDADRNRIIAPNPVIAAIETGEWKTPSDGSEFKYKNKSAGAWKTLQADSAGWFQDSSLNNSYVYFNYQSPSNDIVFLEAMGNSMVYVNGTARSGNPYQYKDVYEDWEVRFDYSLLPVKLKKGKNDLLFACDRGVLKVKVHSGIENLIFNNNDLTIPDIIINEAVNALGAIPIINATESTFKNLAVKTWTDDSEPEFYNVKPVHPLSVFKTPFYIKMPALKDTGKIKLHIELVEQNREKALASTEIILNAVAPDQIRKETFISKMDGSVQYYGVNPPLNPIGNKPALFLSLHGAGVEAINQARSYGQKNWGYIVAPTNRRPYGYNWENWGRLDALEVLAIAEEKFDVDSERVYLTGHSMGGHGTWHLGINYPDKFAAIGPSAGWISIWVYRISGMTDSTETRKFLTRSTKHSDTYAFSTNLKQNGIYIIHGDADDNVPPEQARSMVENLSKFHKNFIYYEEPGAGHWWDNSDEPGADCVDWMPMFDYFAHHSVPGNERVRMIDFVTANPAISSKNYWIEIINQKQQQKLSNINIRLEPGSRRFVGTTDNIETLAIDASMLTNNDPVSVELDKQTITGIELQRDKKIFLGREGNAWKQISEPVKQNKYPARTGNFREALNNNVVFVYGSNGNAEENKWAFEKARYDAERIWYQGNGSIEIISDEEFTPGKYKDRNVILFGNSKTNSAWGSLLSESPVQVDNKKITVGSRTFSGSNYSLLMIRPRKDSEFASVGVVSGTGIKGMNMVNFAPYHHPYVSLPDLVIYNSGIVESDEEGVKMTGYFGNDWSVETGEFFPPETYDQTGHAEKK